MQIDIEKNGKTLTNVDLPQREKKTKPTPVEQDDTPLYEKLERTKRSAFTEEIYASAKSGFANSYIIPFGLLLGATPTLVALLSALPQLLGSISQAFIEKMSHFFRSRYRLYIVASYLQCIAFVPLIFFAVFNITLPTLLLSVIVLEAICVGIQSSIWNGIVGDVVPGRAKSSYLAKRNFWQGLAGFMSMAAAGLILSITAGLSPAIGFAIIFTLGLVSTGMSTFHQKRMHDPNPKNYSVPNFGFKEFMKTLKTSNFGNYTMFISSFKFAVAIASPFFAVYMLKVLNFDYLTFMIVNTISVVSQFAVTPLWGKFVSRIGTKKILLATSFLIVLIPIGWLFSSNWIVLAAVEVFSGIAWSGFNLSASTFVHEATDSKKRLKFYAYNNVLIGVGIFLGTIAGAALVTMHPIFFASAFLMVFFVSAILRFTFALLFLPELEEEKVVSIDFEESGFFNSVTLRPRDDLLYEVLAGDKTNIKEQLLHKRRKIVLPQRNASVDLIPKRMPNLKKLGMEVSE